MLDLLGSCHIDKHSQLLKKESRERKRVETGVGMDGLVRVVRVIEIIAIAEALG